MTVTSTEELTLNVTWDTPLDEHAGIGAGSDSSSNATNGTTLDW